MEIDLIKTLLSDEGFRHKPYHDTEGVLTFGHGLTWISEKESQKVVEMRVSDIKDQLAKIDIYRVQTSNRKKVLVWMAFNLGINGLMMFRKMWAALAREDFQAAADEILDSKAAKQTGERYRRFAKIMLDG